MNEAQTVTPSRFPVSVILQRREARQAGMSLPRWQVVGVVAGASMDAGQRHRTLIRSEGGIEQHLWSDLTVVLHKNDVESYRYNLVATTPSLFVICRLDGNGDPSPIVVTADFEQAGFSMEREGTVFSVPMPPEIYRWLEQYVVENYALPDSPKRKHETRDKNETYDRQGPPGTERRPR